MTRSHTARQMGRNWIRSTMRGYRGKPVERRDGEELKREEERLKEFLRTQLEKYPVTL